MSVLNPENAVDLDGANTGEDAHVHIWRDNGQDNQMWFQGPDGLIRSKLNGYVFDASGMYYAYRAVSFKLIFGRQQKK